MRSKRRLPNRRLPDGRPKNQLLAALRARDFRRLQPFLETVPIHKRQQLHRRDERVDAVYFLNEGVASITTVLPDGTRMEAATVGHEGVLGIEAFFHSDAVAWGDALVQVPGMSAERLDVRQFRRELSECQAFRDLIGHYAHLFIVQMMLTLACRAKHTVSQRCASALLMTHSRMHQQAFKLSHEVLAGMLGACRPTVTAATIALQAAGVIRYRYGLITVLDRRRLARASCQCATMPASV
jgi:CRP-like cAMP-binding protein